MPISPYLAGIRRRVGSRLLLMPSAGAVIRDARGRTLLLVNRDTGGFMLPGGALDPGESAAAAVVREVREETGLVVCPSHLMGVVAPWRVHYPNGDRVDYMAVLFLCRVTGGRLQPADGEASGWAWFPPPQIPPLGYPPALWSWEPGTPALFELQRDAPPSHG